jgi:hypothetical protein
MWEDLRDRIEIVLDNSVKKHGVGRLMNFTRVLRDLRIGKNKRMRHPANSPCE